MARRPVIALACLPGGLADGFADYLDRRGYETVRAPEEWEARQIVTSAAADIIILGHAMPQASVNALLRRLDDAKPPAVILVRPPSDLVERVLALELGAADVIELPVNPRELAARVAGLLVRSGKPGPDLVELENATIDLRSALVMHRTGTEEQLSPGQVAMLRLFLANPRRVLTRDDIIAAAPAESSEAFDRSIDSRIVRLRRKLDTETIVTIRGSGYRFDPPAGRPG